MSNTNSYETLKSTQWLNEIDDQILHVCAISSNFWKFMLFQATFYILSFTKMKKGL